jgi:hypothetical protein
VIVVDRDVGRSRRLTVVDNNTIMIAADGSKISDGSGYQTEKGS